MAANKISAPRGTKDVTPDEVYKWHYVERTAASVARDFGFTELRFPAFEHTELFIRGVGTTTDVVQKEMYTFEDKGGRSITLRPEGTASAVRSYIENSLFANGLPVKAFYLAANFRYEKPQSGRLREHHQFGVECFGAKGAEADSEIIALAYEYLHRLGVSNTRLELNSIGCPNCKPQYHNTLYDYFYARKESLCATCLERLGKNPLRILDCKSEICKKVAMDAPSVLDFLCAECEDHFSALKNYLHAINIDFIVNPRLVRGLDYYTKTVFEFVHNGLGAQDTVIAGGRYDGLVSLLGGQDTPGLGFGSGIERMLLALEHEAIDIPLPSGPYLFVAALGEPAGAAAQVLVNELRRLGISTDHDLTGRSLKAQMKYADKCRARYSLVIGDDELMNGISKLRNMSNGESVPCDLTADSIANLFREYNL